MVPSGLCTVTCCYPVGSYLWLSLISQSCQKLSAGLEHEEALTSRTMKDPRV
uniref:Uncharacterized protein n=1 Tax=Anguilla anguilla TaxID=7936 RepID=A0A0E9SE43_ANGAN